MTTFPRSLLLTLALGGLAFGGVAIAKGQPKAGHDNTAHLLQTYRQDSRQLQSIQQKAIQNTPKLAAEMKHFQSSVKASMRAHGYDVAKGQKRAQAMAAKLRSGKKLSKTQRTAVMKSFIAERQKMMKARSAAMQDPKIQKEGKSLQHDMLAAMKKQDSHTAQLLKDVQSLRVKLRAAMAARQAAPKKGS